MKISDLFRSNSENQSQQVNRDEASARVTREHAELLENAVRKSGSAEDSVSISPLARQLATIRKVVNEDDMARAERVANLKAQVESGNYSVSSENLAQAMIAFAADTEEE